MSDSTLTDLQRDVAARVKADEVLANVAVITEFKGDILSEVQEALGILVGRNGKVGACIIVLQTTAKLASVEIPGAVLAPETRFRILEDPTINLGASGTLVPALTIARRLVRLFHLWRPMPSADCMIAQEPAIEPVPPDLAPVVYECGFLSTESGFDPLERVSTPSISPNGGAHPQTVTLSCLTAGSSIYYTLDGSLPWSGNAQATLYSAPFAVSVAATLRAGAFKSGFVASDVNAVDFS